MSLVERSLYLLQNTRFFTLASRSLVGDVWASTVSYVAAFEPIRIIWCSDRLSKHSENIREHAQVSGAIFRADLQGVLLSVWMVRNLSAFAMKSQNRKV